MSQDEGKINVYCSGCCKWEEIEFSPLIKNRGWVCKHCSETNSIDNGGKKLAPNWPKQCKCHSCGVNSQVWVSDIFDGRYWVCLACNTVNRLREVEDEKPPRAQYLVSFTGSKHPNLTMAADKVEVYEDCLTFWLDDVMYSIIPIRAVDAVVREDFAQHIKRKEE